MKKVVQESSSSNNYKNKLKATIQKFKSVEQKLSKLN